MTTYCNEFTEQIEEKITKQKLKSFYCTNQAKPGHRLYKILQNYIIGGFKMLLKKEHQTHHDFTINILQRLQIFLTFIKDYSRRLFPQNISEMRLN
jgi:hypothetical protein